MGAAEGLLLAGYLGEGDHLLYDIIGPTVHLAARLCGTAEAGQALVTRRLFDAARYATSGVRDLGPLELRGMQAPVRVLALDPGP